VFVVSSDLPLPELLPRIYEELRSLAGNVFRDERRDHTLQPTALVHEAYLRLSTQENLDWTNRGQFFAMAARMMRRVLVDHARAAQAGKRGDGEKPLGLDAALEVFDGKTVDTLALHESLKALEARDPRQGQIVELRFFAGLSVAETAEALAISPATVKREWNFAKVWLEREMSGRR
jgi:RNA polymerase sigma factor (TIGR02999 family)